VFFTKYFSLAFEAGIDHTRSGRGEYDGWLRKFTIAPQLGAGRKFFSRPGYAHFLLMQIGPMDFGGLWVEHHIRTARAA
jgi:maltoporin